jgi:tyrosyl-tRNA synthetase
MYQFFMRTPDAEVGVLLRQFTFLPREEIEVLETETKEHPSERKAAEALARAVCTLVHGEAETERAAAASRALFSEDVAALDEAMLLEVFKDAPSSVLARSELDAGGIALVDVLVSTGLAPSKTAARTALRQGGVYVNNRRRDDPDAGLGREDLLVDRYVLLRRGRRDYHLLRLE